MIDLFDINNDGELDEKEFESIFKKTELFEMFIN